MESKIIISSDNIKPSSPTPRTLKTYNFSMLDQTTVPILVPVVLFFPSCNEPSFISQTTQQLRRSLSVILTRFYPFAGRANQDGQSIDCDDSGVHFVVAKFPGHRLPNLLRNPDKDLSHHLLPGEFSWNTEMHPQSRVLLIQVNYFDCGSIAIGALFWHKVADANTMVNFLLAWARANQGSKEGVCPNYISQVLFPYKEELVSEHASMVGFLKMGKWVTRRYVFHSSAISSLQAKSRLENLTRVEAVSAFIWKCFSAASLENNKSTSIVAHAVNLRGRARPPFPSDCFGNFLGHALTSSWNQNGGECDDLARKLRDAISKIDDDYVSRMQGDGGLPGCRENRRSYLGETPEGADLLSFSSWCRFGVYNIDFGWGKPVWVTAYCSRGSGLETSQYMNLVLLMDTRIGNGIEAWVTLGEEYTSVFDTIKELRDLVSIEPCPLDIGQTAI